MKTSVWVGVVVFAWIAALPIHAVTTWKLQTTEPVVALTFDDGPKPDYVVRLLEILDHYQVKATFFVVGESVLAHPDLILRMAQSGHTLANHSFSHTNLALLSTADVLAQLEKTNFALSLSVPGPVRFFRPPGGNHTHATVSLAEQLGMVTVMWDVNAQDYTLKSQRLRLDDEPIPSEVVMRILQPVQNGSIILCHSGSETTLAILPQVIRTLKKRGYRFVTLNEAAAYQWIP
ncbi:MAG: polysaccharide deacetylase family protein [Candidatus Margulisiibacteriota bacterium]